MSVTPPSDTSQPDPAELDAVAGDLHRALHHDPPLEVAVDPALVDEVRRRSSARRRAKIAATTLIVLCLVVGAGVALAASRSGSRATNLAAGDTDTTALPVTTLPITTLPSTETTPTPFTSTSIGGGPVDCGSATPSGWPTTVAFSPVAAQCLLHGFSTGLADTFTEVIPDTDYPAHQITTTFLVVGVGVVQVRVDRTMALDAPKTIVTSQCRQLSFQPDNPEVYAYGQCTVIS